MCRRFDPGPGHQVFAMKTPVKQGFSRFNARNVISLPPIVQGGILVIPKGMLAAQADGTSVAEEPKDTV